MLTLQVELEDTFERVCVASGMRNVVLLCDRGTMDCKGYNPPEAWDQAVEQSGYSEQALLERYDLVVHLVSTAIGAERHYTNSNNKIRVETMEQAREQDFRERQSWVKHPNRVIVHNGCSFEAKCQRINAAIKSQLVVRSAVPQDTF